MLFKQISRQFLSLCLIALCSAFFVACSDESSSNDDSSDAPTVQFDENGEISDFNCENGNQIIIEDEDVCADD